jgi:hypothetical protein
VRDNSDQKIQSVVADLKYSINTDEHLHMIELTRSDRSSVHHKEICTMTNSIMAGSLAAIAVAAGFAFSTPAFSQGAMAQAQNPAPSSPTLTKQRTDGGDGPIPNTYFTQLPGEIAKPAQQSTPGTR